MHNVSFFKKQLKVSYDVSEQSRHTSNSDVWEVF